MKLFDSIAINNKICRNRVVMAAHSYGYADANGYPTDVQVAYMAERAKGGVGMIIMGGTAVSKDGILPTGNQTQNITDEVIPYYQNLSGIIHNYGALVIDQLMHAGGQLRTREGLKIFGPSPVYHERTRGTPVELDAESIKNIINDFIAATKRAYLGGFDGVELKCDQGFLLHQFISPYYNRRKDEYGGSLINRIEILKTIINRARQVTSTDFIIGIRLSADTFYQGDTTINDTIFIVDELTKNNPVDYFHINGGTNSTFLGYQMGHSDSSIAPGNFVSLTKQIKQRTNIPIIVASGILHPDQAEEVLLSGFADMVAMTRAQIADPELVVKTQSNRVEDIRPCVLCNQGCVGNHHLGNPVRCIHNPAAGREHELGIGTIKTSPSKKIVAVVGGGIAGMEVARISSIRGHEVHVFEKENFLGGQILLASRIPYRQGLLDIAQYLERQARQAGVHFHLGENVTLEKLTEYEGEIDILVLATGSESFVPTKVEMESEKARITTVRDVLSQGISGEKSIIIVDIDWRHNALGFSEWLLNNGVKDITIISPAFYVGEGLDIVTLTSYYSRLVGRIQLLPLTEMDSYKSKTATLRHIINNKTSYRENVDMVIYAIGSQPSSFAKQLIRKKFTFPVYQVGDCSYPLGIPDALLDANRLGRQF